jgi:carboxymethylenebutenolidase
LLEAALTEACVPHDIKEYQDVGQSYMDSSSVPQPVRRLLRMSYSGPEAEDSWRQLFTFFDEYLAGQDRETVCGNAFGVR